MTEFDAVGKREGFDPSEAGRWRPGLRESAFRPQRDPRDPPDGPRGDLRHPRLRRQAPGAALRRPALPRRQRLALSARGLPRAVRAPTSPWARRFASRADRARDPDHDRGDELRGALGAGEGGARARVRARSGPARPPGTAGCCPRSASTRRTLVYQILPSRYGMNPDDLRRADAVEVVVGQGAKPGGGGMLLGQKISDRVAEMRDLPKGIDQRSACRHPDWTGPDDLEIKIGELREITDWEKPIYVKIGATRTYFDVALAVKAGADVIVLDGMEGGTAASQEVFIEHVGIPILAAIPEAVRSLQELDMHRKVQLIVSGGIRSGADVAKALALGADAVSIGVAAVIALGDNSPDYEAGLRGDRQLRRLLRRLARGPRPGRDLHPGRRAGAPLRPRARRPAARQLPARDGARGADACPRLRQVPRPQPGARGHGRADGRGRGDVEGAPRGDRLGAGKSARPIRWLEPPRRLGNGEDPLRALRRPGRRLPAGVPARRHPEDRALPRRADDARRRRRSTSPPASCSAASPASSGCARFLEGAGHELVVTSDKDGPDSEFERAAARRRGRDLPAVLARLPDRRADRQGAEPEARDHRRHRLRPRRPRRRRWTPGITVAEVTYCNSISVSEHVVMMILGAGPQLHPLLPDGRRRRLEHRRLRLALLRPRGDAGRHRRRRADRLGGAAAPEAVRRRPPLHRPPPAAGRGRGGARASTFHETAAEMVPRLRRGHDQRAAAPRDRAPLRRRDDRRG